MADVVLVEATEAITHVAVRGNLDEVGVREVNLKLTSQTVTRRKPAIIDLTDVGFITSLGIGLLVSIRRSMRSLGLGLAVVVGSTAVRRVLEIADIGVMIPLVETGDEALRELGVS